MSEYKFGKRRRRPLSPLRLHETTLCSAQTLAAPARRLSLNASQKATLDEEQAQALKLLRSAIESDSLLAPDDSLGTDDATLLRFLRARSYNVTKTLAMIRDTQEWRAGVCGVGIDELYEHLHDPFDYRDHQRVVQFWPQYYHGVSKDGLPLFYQHFGAIDLKKLYQAVDPEVHWRALLATCEMLPRECAPAASEVAGRKIEQCISLVDMKGFSLLQFWGFKSMTNKMFSISQDHYPETLKKMIIINAPMGFSSVWKVVKPWLSPATQQKIFIMGSNYQRELFEHVDPEQLPKSFGGTCECPNGGCMINCPGPWKDAREKYGVENCRRGRYRANTKP